MELRDGLLRLNTPARPWLIHDGAAQGVDLIAEWKSDDPDWRQVFEDLEVALTYQVHLRLDVELSALCMVDHLIEWQRDAESGQLVERHDSGDLRLSWSGNSNCMHYLLSTEDIKAPIRQCAADMGWTCGVSRTDGGNSIDPAGCDAG